MIATKSKVYLLQIEIVIGLFKYIFLKLLRMYLDWRQCGNSLALCYFAVVMELPDSLWMDCKSEFGVIFLRCSPT